MIITAESHPQVIDAMNLIMNDQGQQVELPVREIPDRWGGYVENINNTLAKLSRTERAPEAEPLPSHVKPNAFLDSEFYTFCAGEYHEMLAISNRDIHYTQASAFLNDFFEDWELTGDDPQREPGNFFRHRRIEWLQSVEQESAAGLSQNQRAELEQLRLQIV